MKVIKIYYFEIFFYIIEKISFLIVKFIEILKKKKIFFVLMKNKRLFIFVLVLKNFVVSASKDIHKSIFNF